MSKRMATGLLVVALAASLSGFAAPRRERRPEPAGEALFSETRPAMGTTFEIHLYAADGARARELFEAAFEEIERVEAALSNYRPASELSRINAQAGAGPVVTDPEVFALVERAFEYSRLSEGAFDITVGRLMKAWGFFRGAGRFPSDEELARARAQAGWRRVALDPARRSVRFLAPGLELDPGGIGKGYALDRVAALLRESGVTAALLTSGSSSVYALGAPPGKAGWTVRVPDPLERARTLSEVVLKDRSLSTSGNYEKFFRVGGRTYCHIMDPRTGRPVEGVLQTTVLAPEATDSDALSTAVFVLGPERGARLLGGMPGTAAFVVTDSGGAGRVVEIRWPGAKAARQE
jgi:FAD:protein FMN transferase